MTIEIYEVGGCIRDDILGLPTKDIDFVVIAPSYEVMRQHLILSGFRIYVEKEEFATIRACVPETSPLRKRTKDADFVLARKDGPSSDGRRPDYVEPGTLHDDLSRRDFTMNAMARSVSGEIIDPFGGQEDLRDGLIRFVGDPMERIEEDGLRVLRAFRFIVTKKLAPTSLTLQAILSPKAVRMLSCVSIERVREEMEKMFKADTITTLAWISDWGYSMRRAVFREGLRLSATLAK